MECPLHATDIRVMAQETAEEVEVPGRMEAVEAVTVVGEAPHRPMLLRGMSARPTTTWRRSSTTRLLSPIRTSSLEAMEANAGA